MKRFIGLFAAAVIVLAVVFYAGFSGRIAGTTQLSIVAGSENQALEPLMRDWAARNNIELSVTYLVD